MKTEGDAVGIRRNELRCCQLNAARYHSDRTCNTRFLFVYTALHEATMKRGNRFLPELQHSREIGPIGSAGQPRLPSAGLFQLSMIIHFPSAIRRFAVKNTEGYNIRFKFLNCYQEITKLI